MKPRTHESGPLGKISKIVSDNHDLHPKDSIGSSNSILKNARESLGPATKAGLGSPIPSSNAWKPTSKLKSDYLRKHLAKTESGSLGKMQGPPLQEYPDLCEIEFIILIYNGEGYQPRCTIKIGADRTVFELRQKVEKEIGMPLHQPRLSGQRGPRTDLLQEQDVLSAYDIRNNHFITMVPTYLNDSDLNGGHDDSQMTQDAIPQTQATPRVQTSSIDYDEDLYIVDPQSHFELLKRLERDVFQRSEYCQSKREYSLTSAVDPVDDDGVFLDEIGLRAPLQRKIRGSGIATKTIWDYQPTLGMFWHLLKSYSIILNACRSLKRMAGLHFCGDTINILVAHEYVDIIEIKTIHIELIELIELGIETALRQILETNLEKLPFEENLTNGVLKPCLWLLKQIGFHFHPHVSPALDASLTFIRKVAIVIDIALVSYVRSHGSGFDTSYFNNDLNQLEISDGEDWLAFRCYFAKLACLDAFLDGKRVWVFDLWHRCFRVPSRRREEQEHGSKSLLARMEDFADIWGPVYTVPTSTGLIKHYGVSKGVICKVYSKKPCAIPGAMTCHFFTRLAFYIRKTSRQLSGGDYLVLTKGDLLLIGAGFCDNGGCPYTISSFTKDVASEMTVLGTKDSFWKTDSRGLAVGLSKYLGVTVSGTQKLIPQTTLKQHILDKWSTTPTRCNPVILNQYLGVEISHCTGNARRISLRELMVSRPVRSVLQSQHPQWYKTQWGTKFSEALHSTNSDDIVDVWEKFPSNRSEMADLVCRVLELLDTTGWNEQHVFKSAVLVDNEEWAVPIEKKLNSWVHVLSDTHLTGTYVITSERCIECEVPDHTIATCGTSQAFTALKTKIATTESPSTTKAEYLLRPLGERFRQIDCGQPTVLLLSPSPKTFARSLFRTKIYDCSECVNSTKPDCSRSTVYFRASTQSYRGRYKNNTILRSANLTGSQQRRVMPGIDQNSSTRRDHRRMRNRTQGEANECQHDDPDLSLWGNSQINPDLIHKHHQFDKIDGNASLTHENEEEQITHNMNRVAINKLLGGDHPNEADPVSLPKRPHAISNERDQRLPTRGARDLDQYDSRHRRTDPRIAGRSNAAYASHPRSSERISRANRSLYDGSLDNMVNYAFASEDDSDADCSTTLRRANHVPALSSPGGWL